MKGVDCVVCLCTLSLASAGCVFAESVAPTVPNPSGNLMVSEHFSEDSSVPDQRIVFDYDGRGNKVTERRDRNGDGTVDRVDTFTYHPDGSLKTVRLGSYQDGVPVSLFAYDDNEALVMLSIDGEVETYTNDAHGNRLTANLHSGRVERWVHTYDVDDNLLSRTWDDHDDGTVDGMHTHTYDDAGNRLTTEYRAYTRTRGVANERTVFTYDGNSNLLAERRDKGIDGVVEEMRLYSYDARGNMLTKRHTDGNEVEGLRWAYTYDDDDNLLTERNWNGGRSSGVITREYDARGNLVSERHDLTRAESGRWVHTYSR